MQKKIEVNVIRTALAAMLCVILAGGIFGSAPAAATANSTSNNTVPAEETAGEPVESQNVQIQTERREEIGIKKAAAKPAAVKPCIISLKSTETNLQKAIREDKKAVKTAQETARNEAMKQAHEAADAEIQKEQEEAAAQAAAAAQEASEQAAAEQQEAHAQTQSQEADTSAASSSSSNVSSSDQLPGTVYMGRLYIGGYSADFYRIADGVPDVGDNEPLSWEISDRENSGYYEAARNYFGDHAYQGFTEIMYNDTATWVKPDGSTQILTKVWQGAGRNTGTNLVYSSDGTSALYNRKGTYLTALHA